MIICRAAHTRGRQLLLLTDLYRSHQRRVISRIFKLEGYRKMLRGCKHAYAKLKFTLKNIKTPKKGEIWGGGRSQLEWGSLPLPP